MNSALVGTAPRDAISLQSIAGRIGLLPALLVLLVAGMFLDAVSIYLIMLPLLVPLMRAFQWDPVWFGVMMTMNLAIVVGFWRFLRNTQRAAWDRTARVPSSS